MIDVFTTGEASSERLTRIRRLLDLAFAGRLTDDDWEHALGGRHVIVEIDGELVAHGAVVERRLEVGERELRTGYVEAVATHPAHRRRGHGSRAMAELARIIRRDFEMGALSTGAHGFYARHGWERWRGPTWVRDGERRLRSADEDDGIMVLRFGPSAGVELTAPITCRARSGDDW